MKDGNETVPAHRIVQGLLIGKYTEQYSLRFVVRIQKGGEELPGGLWLCSVFQDDRAVR